MPPQQSVMRAMRLEALWKPKLRRAKLLYGPRHSVAAFLAANGYGGHGRNLASAYEAGERGSERSSAAAWAKARARGR